MLCVPCPSQSVPPWQRSSMDGWTTTPSMMCVLKRPSHVKSIKYRSKKSNNFSPFCLDYGVYF